MSSTKTVEPFEMLFVMENWVGPSNRVLTRERDSFRGRGQCGQPLALL